MPVILFRSLPRTDVGAAADIRGPMFRKKKFRLSVFGENINRKYYACRAVRIRKSRFKKKKKNK